MRTEGENSVSAEHREDEVLVQLADIRAAAARIAPYVARTPLLAMRQAGFAIKAENLQPTGAFKVRGAFNAILSLSPAERAAGIVASSSGNHGQAVAYACHRLGLAAHVVMPEFGNPVKAAATARWGAKVTLQGRSSNETAALARAIAAESGAAVIHPYDDRRILCGAGTMALEILEDAPETEEIFVPVSGGGLISGVAAAAKALKPSIRIVGVEPALAADAAASLRQGRIVAFAPDEVRRTICDGLRVTQLGDLGWRHIAALVDEIVSVEEDEIGPTLRRIAGEAKLVSEPSGSVTSAALLRRPPERNRRAVAVLSGGNVDLALYASLLAGAA